MTDSQKKDGTGQNDFVVIYGHSSSSSVNQNTAKAFTVDPKNDDSVCIDGLTSERVAYY